MTVIAHARRFGLLALLCASAGAYGQYGERILEFDSVIEVKQNGSAVITETITVRANSDQIQRGIFRDLPMRGIRPERVLRDGQAEDYHLERGPIGTRIYIGSADRYLSPGEYTYTIAYEWPRLVRYFDDHDEVYWNVTGTQWAFAMDRASARVVLPASVETELLSAEGYTGREGATGTAYSASTPEPGVAEYETTRSLGRNEGLTVVLAFPKGIVDPPTGIEAAIDTARYVFTEWAGPAAFGVLVIYYFTIWVIAGRDPSPGRIIPIDHPPAEHSPAACRYVRNMGADTTAFSVAIVNLAHKGYLRIEQDDGGFALVRETASKEPLYPDERALVDKLFAEKSELKVSRSDSNSEFMNARFAAAQSLKQDYAGLYFKRNLMYLVPGFVLSLMALYEVFPDRADINDIELVFFMSIFVLVWSVAVTFLAWLAFSTWRQNREETEDKDTAGTVLIYVITGIFWIAEIILWSVLAVNSSFIYAACIFLVAVVNAVFGSILRRHTSVGRQLLDRIECFEQWLKDETVHRFAAAGPEEASRRFERFLPYAMALNREAEWSSEFESALETAATEETTREYEPYWYRRRQTPSSSQPVSIGSFMTAFSESFNRAVNTASTTASSSSSSGSSGSGGGGSSGGGSGGGGGGGW